MARSRTVARHIEGADDELFHRCALQRVELDIRALQLGHEFRVLDHRLERVAQRLDAVGGEPGRRDHRASDRAAAGIKREHLLVLGGVADLAQARRLRQFGDPFRCGLQYDPDLALAQPGLLSDFHRRP